MRSVMTLEIQYTLHTFRNVQVGSTPNFQGLTEAVRIEMLLGERGLTEALGIEMLLSERFFCRWGLSHDA